ncbi:MAG: DNA gyrase/topoisomerase IV subunit A [Bacteroidales bacterium]|nr:DNA gyrase/topoisomerase IV subunit A [Bacteroidales bacterium]
MDEILDKAEETFAEDEDIVVDDNGAASGKFQSLIEDGSKRKYKLSGMFHEWYLDYASYVILERAVPHVSDGLKPVQRRILHAMKLNDDGRYNKVATLVGATMPFHPHGDAAIKDAMVQIGQKGLLIDCQGNWGNILTGDDAAAGRYIEARLTPFANEVVFNNKTTEWVNSYDGRNQEPVSLPVKFPLLLAMGSKGIAVGLACEIFPHNFNELIEASIAHYKGEPFMLFPDFPTGGLADVSGYNHGRRGGKVKVRARISKLDKNTLEISELPFGKTTDNIIDSILKANEKGKIKVRKVEDHTAEQVSIVITLPTDVSPDKTIDALYAFTDCEVSLASNTCVIKDKMPCFLGVEDILSVSAEHTKELFRWEFEIRLGELDNEWHNSSLEKIFFEEKVYKILENNASTWELQLKDVKEGMLLYQDRLRHPITDEDILRLVDKPVKKISRFDVKAVNEKIKGIEEKERQVRYSLEHLTEHCIDYFTRLKEKYGAGKERRTEITSIENIETTKVVANNAKLYVNRAEGFIGTSMKKIEEPEYVCDCSDIDDVIVFLKDGRYVVKKVADKLFVNQGIMHVAVFRKNDSRTTYNVIYRDGRTGPFYAKRFCVTGVTRDKWYDTTMGTANSNVLWFTVNPNGEAETVRVYLRPKPKLKKTVLDYDFSEIAIKGRSSRGNIVTKFSVARISMHSAGESTLSGKKIWFDWDVCRLNEDGRGELLGEFKGHEHLLAICKDGTYYTTGLDLSTRFQGELDRIEIFNPDKVWTALLWDNDKDVKAFYVKRFCFEISDNTPHSFISEAKGSYLVALNTDQHPCVQISFTPSGKVQREPELINVEEFISVKGFRAKGKRCSSRELESVCFTAPLIPDDEPSEIRPTIEEPEPDNDKVIDFNELDDELTLF